MFSPSFVVGQSAETPANVVFTDDSAGSDVLITSRRIYITDSQGNPVVPSGTSTSYILWPLATNPLTVSNLLTTDLAVNIDVQWLDVSNAVLYEEDADYCLAEFNKQFFYYLIQQQALKPGIIQDNAYYTNLCQYWINIIGAIQTVENAADLSGAQNCLNIATNFMNNQNLYF